MSVNSLVNLSFNTMHFCAVSLYICVSLILGNSKLIVLKPGKWW